MQLSDFDYELPEELIAQAPVTPRGQSRLLVLERDGAVSHKKFADLPHILGLDHVLILNDTRVFPARLVGRKRSGGRVEILLGEQVDRERQLWLARVRSSRKPSAGTMVTLGERLEAELIGDLGHGRYGVKFHWRGNFDGLLESSGSVPLPPYIHRSVKVEADREWYQTVFAALPGACAAPTAGLHFTAKLMEQLLLCGVRVFTLTLHVGPGTFEPVRTQSVENHRMEGEWYHIPCGVADAINEAMALGKRIVAVGTTSTRALESAFHEGRVQGGTNMTTLFIRPGHRFGVVDSLLTNFHLPRSTPLVLLSAFAGRERVLAAYEDAKRRGYRFLSYGDAFLAL
jgi:S-adenosylmethionine:tRNA ribosyltransferase-isomerase